MRGFFSANSSLWGMFFWASSSKIHGGGGTPPWQNKMFFWPFPDCVVRLDVDIIKSDMCRYLKNGEGFKKPPGGYFCEHSKNAN